MLHSKQFFTLCTAILLSLTSVAAELNGPIPMDLARILFDLNGNNRFAIYTDIPDDFPQFAMPAGFTLIASMRNGNSKIIALETTVSREEAEELFIAAFEADGWINLPLQSNRGITGFITADTAPPRPSLCHDEFGRLGFYYAIHDG